ncbi:glycerate kinase [Corynebacterium mayonis]|uniref:glycerate kinase n=1 Tax=Corynebacterium mayonis TaxID=3062461 RepID=UPI00313FE3A2
MASSAQPTFGPHAHNPHDASAPSPVVLIATDAGAAANHEEIAAWIAEGVRSVIQDAKITLAPLSNGTAGTAALFVGETVTLPTTDSAGRLTEASYTFDPSTSTAFIDLAAATGQQDAATLLGGDTYGTGVLIADAQTRGAKRIVLATGGDSTLDGGTGILVALGAAPLNAAGYSIHPGARGLCELATIDTAQLNIPAASLNWLVLADDTPTATEAARRLGQQLGAPEKDIAVAEQGLARLVEVTGVDPDAPGMGAGGAAPISITWLSHLLHGTTEHITVIPGAQFTAAMQGLDALAAGASFVITADIASGGAPGGVTHTVAAAAAKAGRPTGVISGSIGGILPEGVLEADIDFGGNRDQLRRELTRAGAELTVDYLRISTVQG